MGSANLPDVPIDEVGQVAENIGKYGSEAMLLAVVIFLLLLTIVVILALLISQVKNLNKQNSEMFKFFTDSESIKTKKEPIVHAKKETVESHLIYMEMMKDMCRKAHTIIKCDRVALYVFHNGQVTLSGFPFMKSSCISEWCSYSDICKLNVHKDLLINLYIPMISHLCSDGCYTLMKIDDLKDVDNLMYKLFVDDGIKSMFAKAIIDTKGNLIGYICAQFMNNYACENIKAVANEELKKVALKANPLLELSKDQLDKL